MDSALVVTRDELMAIDEEAIRALCGEKVFAEAEAILAHGLSSPMRNGLTIGASLMNERGWRLTPRVSFRFADLDERCDCRSSDRFCAHLGALLLLWARRPGAFAVEGEPQERFSVSRKWNRRADRSERIPVRDSRFELRMLLSSMLVADLRNLGRRLEVRLRGSAKSDLVEQLVATLSEPSYLEQAFAALAPDLRLALAATYALSDRSGASSKKLKVALGRLVPSGLGADSLVGELQARGLVFGRGDEDEPWLYQVPFAYWSHLPPLDAVERVAKPDEPTRLAGSLADSLLAIWWSIRDEQLRLAARPVALPDILARAYPPLQDPGYVREEVRELTRSGMWADQTHELTVPRRTSLLGDSSLRDLGARVGGAEQAELGWNLLGELGLIAPGEVMSALDEPARELLWLSRLGRLRAVVDAWLRLTGWSEADVALVASPRLRLRRRLKVGHSSYFADWAGQRDLDEMASEGRRFVLRVISLLPEDVWLRTESLLNLIWRIWPDFLYGDKSRESRPAWWLEADGRRLDAGRFADWARGPGAVVTALVAGPLHWLGLADLAGPAAHPTAFRLRPEARLLRGGEMAEEATLAPVALGPDLEVRVKAGYPDPELRDLLSTAGGLLETSASGFRYQLAPEGARSLFEAGQSADDLLALLGRRAESVPAELRATIERWWQLYGGLRLAEGLTLVELSDDHLLDELLVATSLRRHLIHRLTPRLLVIDPAGADDLFAELRGRGYLPRREPLEGAGRGDHADPSGGER